jgi:manganese transport protein
MKNNNHKSLDEVNASVNTSNKGGFKKLLAFIGPAYMISVGYMDPGNWATDIEGGSKYGYSLIWVLVMSNLIALLLQSHCIKLGVVSGRDLAQASKDHYSKFINYFLYALAEIAIAACDLAEVVGMAIGIHLLFPSISILMGVCITVLDSFVLLFLLNSGIKKLEAFIISLVAIIGVSFFIQLVIAKPDVIEISKGLIPGFTNENALYIAIGIIGATVMPHNLYLHSSLVQTRKFERTPIEIKKAIRFNIIDSAVALNLALFVNAAILIIAASTFFNTGIEVTEIQDAHKMMAPMLGSTLAPLLFAIALIAAGQSSTITGTLAGQIIMEGYLNMRLQPWIRRLLTRLIAIVPAFLTIYFMGEDKTGDLLVLSQVILSLQLGFAIIPLIHFVSSKKRMGEFVIPLWQKIASWVSVSVIVFLNCQMLFNTVKEWMFESEYSVLISVFVIPFMLICLGILFYIIFEPLFKKSNVSVSTQYHGDVAKINFETPKPYSLIAITVDFSSSDNKAINKAIMLGGTQAHYILIHILESTNAVMYGENTNDHERNEDSANLLAYKNQLIEQGYNCEFKLGFGSPKSVIPKLVKDCDLLVMGTHGHTTFKDLLFGTTVESVRHKIDIPLVLV